MANEIKEMSEIIKKCKILLLDIEGTTTSISFVKDKLFPYAEENVKQFLNSQWDSDDVKQAVSGLRKLALEDKENNVEGLVAIPGEESTKEEQIEGLVNNVKWQMSSDRKVGALKFLQGLIWKQGYDNGDIKGHVYDDVSPALELWRSAEGQKIYIYSSGSVDAQKLLFGQSLAGNLLHLIDGHFDTAVGAKQEAASYVKIVEKIGCKADEILFLTDIPKEAEAAKASGLNVALVSREGNAPLPSEATDNFPVIHSFQQLAVTNKRKPDPQDDQPAKVPKTDVEDDVKSLSETEPKTEVSVPPPEAEETKEAEKTEEMEVEEVPEIKPMEEVEHEKKAEVSSVDTSTTVEEISDSKDIGDTPIVDIKPIVTEEGEKTGKTEQNETEKMEAELIETPESNESKESSEMKNGDSSLTPTTVITEIEEVTEKQDLADVDEIIDDLEPVVEEPPTVEDMEDLQNVGEVLEKECDEILSKVQDVTNLDNIPIKPLLNTITEEAMETENADSNDIVDRILDTELEMENMKECEDIDLNTVQEITDAKSDAPEEKSGKVESSAKIEVPIAEEKVLEEKMEETLGKNDVSDVTDGNIVSSPKETEKEKCTEKEKEKEVKIKESENNETESAKPEVESKEASVEESTTSSTEDSKEKDESVVEEVKANDVLEKQVNGKATNGDTKPNLNGDASKDEELNSRLAVEENGKEVNGDTNGAANGEANGADKGGESKEEVTDIKVKSVAVDEPRTDPIEQPTEA